MKIKKIIAREILDSRGNPTVEAEIFCDKFSAVASVPSGASTGTHEALELRDNDKKRFGGKGVLRAVENVNTKIAEKLRGFSVLEQEKIDDAMIELDGTENKSNLGANAILAVSLAVSRAGAMAEGLPLYKYINKVFFSKGLDSRLRGNDSMGGGNDRGESGNDRERGGDAAKKMSMPQPMMNILNGGAHADFVADIQEFMILPKAVNFAEKVRIGAEVFHALKNVLKKNKLTTGVGDEGGFAPNLKINEDGFRLISQAVKEAGYKVGQHIEFAIDAAASEFYKKGKYALAKDKKIFTAKQLLAFYKNLVKKYPLVSIEDGFAEDDWEGWKIMKKDPLLNPPPQRGGGGVGVMQVGDDLFVTNVKRLGKGINEKVANAILIKPNQIGTLSETIDAIKLAQEHKYKVVISHRSGETADTFISDLSVACGAEFIKTGSLSRSERVEKYNRLMKIERELMG